MTLHGELPLCVTSTELTRMHCFCQLMRAECQKRKNALLLSFDACTLGATRPTLVELTPDARET